MDWFLYDNGLHHERVKQVRSFEQIRVFQNLCSSQIFFSVESVYYLSLDITMTGTFFWVQEFAENNILRYKKLSCLWNYLYQVSLSIKIQK